MSNTKRCGGHKGHWECSEEYPDHTVPRSEFGTHSGHKDGLQDICRKCMDYRNTNMPRHPDTDQRKMHWLTSRAEEYYGGKPEDLKNDKHWKACRDMANKDAESIAWVSPNDSQPSNVIPFKAKPKPAVTLKSTVRNDGLPKGIVTPSEKKVRREAKKIKYAKLGWVYALKDHMKQPGFIKIGSSNDLKRRLSDFNTAGDFEMMYFRKVPDCKKAETEVQMRFEEQNHIREWFKVSLEDVVEAIDIVADLSTDPDWDGIVDLGDADDA